MVERNEHPRSDIRFAAVRETVSVHSGEERTETGFQGPDRLKIHSSRMATARIGEPVPLRIFSGRAMKVKRLPTSRFRLQRFSM